MWGDWDIHKGPKLSEHVCTQLSKGGVTDIGIQVDKHICTDACTHSNQGTGSEER